MKLFMCVMMIKKICVNCDYDYHNRCDIAQLFLHLFCSILKQVQMVSFTDLAFASCVACFSHVSFNISPIGSISLTPLSSSGLCDAVIITPIPFAKRQENGIIYAFVSVDLVFHPYTNNSVWRVTSVTTCSMRSHTVFSTSGTHKVILIKAI